MHKLITFGLGSLVCGCTDTPLNQDERATVANVVAAAVDTINLYPAIYRLPASSDGVMGTRSSFTVDSTGTMAWEPGSVRRLTGSGDVHELTATMDLVIAVDNWRTDLADLQLIGTFELAEGATYAAVDDLMPSDFDKRVTGDVSLTGEIDGMHRVDLVFCNRDVWDTYRWGLRGTIDDQPVTNHHEDNDEFCEPL